MRDPATRFSMKYGIPLLLAASMGTSPGLCLEPTTGPFDSPYGTARETPAVPEAERRELEVVVKNRSYRLLLPDRTVVLKDGAFTEGDSPGTSISVSLARHLIADVNDDGALDIIVVMEHHGMGSASFYELSVLMKQGDQFRQTTPVLLGDNIMVKGIAVEGGSMWSPGEIVVSLLTHNTSDAHAKPTLETQRCYVVENNELTGCDEIPIVKKPAIYLYPTEKTTVGVKLKPKGKVIQSIPSYGDGWRVTVDESGLIDREYRYLFYEAALDGSIALPEEGWSVQYEDLGGWFDRYLGRIGLNDAEANDLKSYWLANLPAAKYYTIRMVDGKTVDNLLGLAICPKPDNLLRVLLHFSPSDARIVIREPAIAKFHRKGFVAVEWGGVIGSGQKRSIVK